MAAKVSLVRGIQAVPALTGFPGAVPSRRLVAEAVVDLHGSGKDDPEAGCASVSHTLHMGNCSRDHCRIRLARFPGRVTSWQRTH